tara:strand:+ start:307 stop:495 length:189 start_codon:yes stop_codon:yes gene_type:complete
MIIMEYKVKKLIMEILNNTMEDYKKQLSDMQKDEDCSAQIYEQALDKCKELEYAIHGMERHS